MTFLIKIQWSSLTKEVRKVFARDRDQRENGGSMGTAPGWQNLIGDIRYIQLENMALRTSSTIFPSSERLKQSLLHRTPAEKPRTYDGAE